MKCTANEGTICKMSSRWSWVMNALYISLSVCSLGVSGGLVQSCGYIIPESPVLTLGSNFTALCILNESCLDFGNIHANQIIWKIKNSVVPKEQYRVINRTVSSVTFSDTSTLATPLTCNVLADGQIEQNIYGIAVILGLPPEKPENLSCIVHQMSKTKFIMTCTWNPGRDTFLATDFRLKSQWPLETLSDCEPQGVNNSCDIFNVQFFVNLEVWVEANNALGKAESEHIDFDPVDIVKPLPPHNLAVNSGELPTVLKLSWENQISLVEMELKFIIRYRISDSPDWMEVPPEDTASHRTSFTVQSLKPYTKYVFSLRCMKKDGLGYWSDWSKEKSGVTSEAKPSKGPPLWRKIGISHSPNFWTVHLIWKELDRSEANGIILRYEVTVRARPPLSRASEKYSVNSTNLTLNLTNGTYDVTVTAHNRIGGSPPSVLLIPASNSKASVTDIKAFPKDGKLWVEWTAPDNSVVKYVIEWCTVSDSSDCTAEWQQELGTSQGTFLKGDIKPFKCYLITVHPLYNNGQGNGQSTKAYLQQSRPARGPTVQTKKVGKAEAVLVWKPLSVDEQNGFIKYYTILYRTISGNETAVKVDPSKTEYTLSSLSSDTLYMVKMEAHTDEGGTSGPVFTFTTQKFVFFVLRTLSSLFGLGMDPELVRNMLMGLASMSRIAIKLLLKLQSDSEKSDDDVDSHNADDTRLLVAFTDMLTTVERHFLARETSTEWWDHIVMQVWLQNFRMRKATFMGLCTELAPTLQHKDTRLRVALPVEKQVAIAIWKLATPDSYR